MPSIDKSYYLQQQKNPNYLPSNSHLKKLKENGVIWYNI